MIMNSKTSNWCRNVITAFLVSIASLSAATNLQLVSISEPSAGASGDSYLPVISADGRYVLFASTANNLVLTTNHTPIPALIPASLNVYLRDRASNTTVLVSANLAGTGGGNGNSLPWGISTNGQYVLFESAASDLVANDTNNAGDVFVRDMVNGTTLLVSVSADGTSGSDVCEIRSCLRMVVTSRL